MTLPPTDSGGPGHRPPDTAKAERRQLVQDGSPSTKSDAVPPISQENLGGPHQVTTPPSAGTEPFPALVTTPSDAQGGKGTVIARGSGLQRAEDGAGTKQGSEAPGEPTSYAAAVQKGGPQGRTADWSAPKHIAGNWNPRERHLLLTTLAQDWAVSSAPIDTSDQALLRQVALAPSKVHANDALRARTATETQVLLHYLDRTLELPHAPNFLKATLPLLQRAMIEQFHEEHCEVMLTADILPRAKLRRNMTHNNLFAQLHAANSDSAAGRGMLTRLLEDVKRMQFDGLHTLKFVFNSARVARRYTGSAVRLNGTCIELEDTTADSTRGTYRPARLRRHYAVRAYGVDALGLVVFLAALSQLNGVEILDAERARVDISEIIDNNYFLLRFTAEHCPDTLRGVTKLTIYGHVVTLHHHVIYQRLPCARCYAPYHTTGFCKAKPAQLNKTQDKFQRSYKGLVPVYEVGKVTQYRHTDGDSLNNFLATLHSELAGAGKPAHEGAASATSAELVTEVRVSERRQALSRNADAEDLTAAGLQEDMVTPQGTIVDGFTVVTRRQKRAKQHDIAATQVAGVDIGGARTAGALEASRQDVTVGVSSTGGATPHTGVAPLRPRKPTPENKQTQAAPARAKAKAKANAYVKFKQAHALGRFTVLADQETDGQVQTDDEEQDEAPYAYPPDMIELFRPETEEDLPATAGAIPMPPSAGLKPEGAQPGTDDDEDMPSAEDEVLSSYVGSSAPSSTQSPASMPGSEIPYSLQSEVEIMDTAMEGDSQQQQSEDEEEMKPRAAELEPSTETGPSLSQDGFSIEHITAAPGMPQQMPIFLNPFRGSLTKVPANGQCAYAALYATMTSTTEASLQFTAAVVKGANIMKKSIYTLMLANLANDVECKIVDPCRELRRLYPSQPAPTDPAVATAALYTHYTQERSRTVNSQIPSAFWAGPEVLRAMAQYLREPLFVLDVDQHNDTHVQRYYYRDYTLPNGDIHETGCGGAMDDATAKEMLAQYARLHVLPVFLVLKSQEGHFYGVHHGDIAIKWHAEGDLEFAQDNCSEHPWYSEVIAHIEYSQGLLAQVDFQNDDDATNSILIGAMERRARLDVVHDRLQLERLDRDPYDIAILESGLAEEEDRLQSLAGTGGLIADSGAGTDDEIHARRAKRGPISPQGKVVLPALQRILNSINMDPELVSDRSKFRQLKAENFMAIKAWLRQSHVELRQPPFHGSKDDFIPLMRWLTTHRAEMQSLLRYVPYPEVVAKMLPSELLLQWGELEGYDLQVATIRNLILHEDVPIPAKEYCRSWLAACTTEVGSARDRRLAKDPQRWKRLQGMYSAAPDCACPPGVREECWYVLHTLPHVVWAWKATPWGCLPKSQLGAVFKVHPAVQQVCQHIVEDAAWGFTVLLPTGLTWEARMDAMAAGLAAAPRR